VTEFNSTEFDTECLFCGTVQELHASMEGAIPKPGDLSICFSCGYVAAYGDDVTRLVPLTPEQQLFTESNDQFRAMMFALRVMKNREADQGRERET
jgi:hypothetical protein